MIDNRPTTQRPSMWRQILMKLFCLHEWKVEKEVKTWERGDPRIERQIIFIYRCDKCGRFKKIVT